MALQGTLDTFALPDVLRLLAATRKTGRLRLSGTRGTGAVWVEAGTLVSVEAAHAPHASDAVDALFELLRFQDGSFTFDVDVVHEDPAPAVDVEELLAAAEAQLAEWLTIEAIVPSLDAWVSLRRDLPTDQVVIDRDRWATLVAVGAGATVRRVGDELCLSEMAVSREIKALVELGVAEVDDTPPSGSVVDGGPMHAAQRGETGRVPGAPAPVAPSPVAAAPSAPAPATPARLVPWDADLDVDAPASGGPARLTLADEMRDPGDEPAARTPDGPADRHAAAGSGNQVAPSDAPDDDLARQLANLSPRAAEAVRAATQAGSDDEREAALAEAEAMAADEDDSINRGLLLKFLSSVKS